MSVRKRKGLFGHKPRKNCQNEKQEMKLETNQEMLLLLLSKKTSNCENRFLQIGLVGSITLLAPGERIAHFNAMDFSPIFNYGAPKILPIFDHHLNLIHLQYLKREDLSDKVYISHRTNYCLQKCLQKETFVKI